MRRAVWPFLVSIVVVGVLFLLVFPARTYLGQRRSLAAAEHRVSVLSGENATLDQRVAKLQDQAEIERIAREQYGLVKPGEEAYAILPPPTVPAPEGDAPAATAKPPHRTWYQRLWHKLT